MIKHIVMWKLKDLVNEDSKEENAIKIKAMLESLKDKIDVIKEIEVGINFESSDSAYDIVLNSTFESIEDLDAYQVHEEHIKVATFVRSVVDTRAVVDYKI